MDMSKYMGSNFIKVDDLESGPQHKTIADIEDGKFDKPVALFDDGTRISLNKTNARALGRVFGTDSGDWIGQAIELYVGVIEYNGANQPAVLMRPLTSPAAVQPQPAQNEMDDEIPF